VYDRTTGGIPGISFQKRKMYFGQLVNGIGLVGIAISGLVAPTTTVSVLNTVLTQIPWINTFPVTGVDSAYAKMAFFTIAYIGTIYLGLSSSKEFAKYSILSRLCVFPVMAAVGVQTMGLNNAVFAFAALDVPCALWTRYELQGEPTGTDNNNNIAAAAAATTTTTTTTTTTPATRQTISRDRDFKMVLVVNTDLKMKKGKIAAQAAHAAVGVLDEPGAREDPVVVAWQRWGCAKVALKASHEQMKQAAQLAEQAGLRHYTVCDAGRTQIPAGSETVCAIGPFDVEEIDKITGRSGVMPLKLL